MIRKCKILRRSSRFKLKTQNYKKEIIELRDVNVELRDINSNLEMRDLNFPFQGKSVHSVAIFATPPGSSNKTKSYLNEWGNPEISKTAH